MSNEKRSHERKSVAVTFWAHDALGAGQLVFTSDDLSVGGTFLRADLLLEQGEPLSLEFTLPGVMAGIKCQARVAWVRRFPLDAEAAGMGVEFTQLAPADREALTDFIRG